MYLDNFSKKTLVSSSVKGLISSFQFFLEIGIFTCVFVFVMIKLRSGCDKKIESNIHAKNKVYNV